VQTYAVAYTPEGKDSQPIATFEKKVDDTPVNDITARRNDFMIELASKKRMTKKEARSFIGDGAKDILAGLVGDGSILEVARGRSAGYSLPEKTTTTVNPAPIPPAVIVATLTAPVASSEDIPAGFDNGEPTTEPTEPTAPPADDKPAKKTRKPRKSKKAAPTDVERLDREIKRDAILARAAKGETSPIANASDDDKREFINAIVDMAKQKGMVPTPDNTAPSADAIGAAFLTLGKRVSVLDTVKAKKAVKLMAELRGLLS
jgi:hypothetical protein